MTAGNGRKGIFYDKLRSFVKNVEIFVRTRNDLLILRYGIQHFLLSTGVTSAVHGGPVVSCHRMVERTPEGEQAGGGQPTGTCSTNYLQH